VESSGEVTRCNPMDDALDAYVDSFATVFYEAFFA